MQIYAHVVAGRVARVGPLAFPDLPIAQQMHPTIAAEMVDVTEIKPEPKEGWAAAKVAGAWTFTAPAAPSSEPSSNTALAALAARRYEAETAGIEFTPTSAREPIKLPTDRQSQTALALAALRSSEGPISWKIADGRFVTLSATDILTAAKAVHDHVQKAFAREAALAPAVEANPETDISGGWPP